MPSIQIALLLVISIGSGVIGYVLGAAKRRRRDIRGRFTKAGL